MNTNLSPSLQVVVTCGLQMESGKLCFLTACLVWRYVILSLIVAVSTRLHAHIHSIFIYTAKCSSRSSVQGVVTRVDVPVCTKNHLHIDILHLTEVFKSCWYIRSIAV